MAAENYDYLNLLVIVLSDQAIDQREKLSLGSGSSSYIEMLCKSLETLVEKSKLFKPSFK